MAKPRDTPGFQGLLEEWNQKLRESGFEDIEDYRNGEYFLKSSGWDYQIKIKQSEPITREAKARYYEILGDRIRETTFDNPEEQKILTLYYEGVSQAEIKRRLKIQGHRSKVYRPIYKWLKKWLLK